VLADCEVTVTVAEVVLLNVTFELVVLQLYVPPAGVPVAVRLMVLGPVEPEVRKATLAGPEMVTVITSAGCWSPGVISWLTHANPFQ